MTAPREGGPFRRRTLGWVIGISVASFLCALLLGVFGEEIGGLRSSGADTFSTSALGHRAFLELVRRAGIPVLVSRHASGSKSGSGSVLCLLEPLVRGEDSPRKRALEEILAQAKGVVLVALPKWEAPPDPKNPRHVTGATLRHPDDAEDVLEAAGLEGSLVRVPSAAFAPAAEGPGRGVAPTTTAPVQLLHSSSLTPVIAAGEGILLAEGWSGSAHLYILSDPDLLANHGLGDGQNAALALGIIESLRGPGGAVVIDETLHGFELEPTLWRELFEFPLVLAVSQAVLTLLILLWAALGRFGAPIPAARGHEPGKAFLIGNIAELLRYGGHTGHTVARYLATTIQDLGRLLHAPPSVGPDELPAWLARVAAARGVTTDLRRLEEEVAATARGLDERRLVLLAHRIHAYRLEMIDGSGTRP